MKNLFTAVIFFFATSVIVGQDCKVLLESLQGEYEGKCKKGMAHGQGIAIGIDRYDGNFKKGLPQGQGVYIWSNGAIYDGEWLKGKRHGYGVLSSIVENKEVVKKGYWEDNQYTGVYKRGEESKTINKMSINTISYKHQSDEGVAIHIMITRMGLNMMGKAEDIRLSPSSGFESVEPNKIIYDSVTFPFRLKISFKGPNKLETSTVTYEAEFILNKPGKWEVKLDI